ncbi:hypothetical protein PIROE2DRAFT_2232 [Piromyces sp. E2]|nr:hypothetical protein PIROE2DRAFT_2232 [Piromyces sp. E2]|eukprot:OUM69805.1 hypothetical protein PIROE2DRAFT_2232 [Piromyces sp. E2]
MESLTFDSDGNRIIKSSRGYDAIKEIELITNVQPRLLSKKMVIKKNGTQVIKVPDGYYGINQIELDTNIHPRMKSKEIFVFNVGKTIAKHDPNNDALNKVIVNINTPFTIENYKIVNIVINIDIMHLRN